ncbi:MAG: tetratricopeptide repeat protein, partial [Chloroflexi bacterium]|nr:tetratricopeptide repeat protein [Chloroflexota bacterium]
MIRCPNCSTEAAPGSRFCPGCGNVLLRACPSCGQAVNAGMAFCAHCGTRMGETPAPAPAPPAEDPERLQLATVLFGDVKGFTAMSEHLPPEQVTQIMNECFEALSQEVVQYGGHVLKYIGDAIMAAFGWPQAHEDDPVRAVHAALAMQRALTKFAARLKATRGFDLAMRIGINSGQVFVAQVGGKGFARPDLMGNTVNLASRLEHEAVAGSVLVGANTHRLSRHAFEFKAMPPMEIRGQSEKINAFVPLRPKTGAPEAKGGGQLRLIGRERELRQLDSLLRDARAGQGRLVALVADPGLGKSRLVEEFWKRHLDVGFARVYAAAPSFGESIPYSMLSNVIRSLLFGEAADHEITVEELRTRLAALLPVERNVDDAVALLDDFLGIEGGEETEVAQLEARSRQAMLTNVLKMLLVARSRHQPLLLNLEDLHWADSASLDVLTPLLTGIQNLQVMVLLTHRPRFSHSWSSLTFYREIRLQVLSREHAIDLLAEFFGSNAIPVEVGERVIDKSGGNPFFLEQLLNNLVQTGAVVQRGGRWELAGDLSSLSVPDTIQEILQARIDQLPRSARGILETAAVIGRNFLHRLLQAVSDNGSSVDDQLKLLKRQEFISEKSVVPELEYMFTHALMQDVVYHGLPEARRRVLHERVAQAIESLGLTDQLALLAVHYEKTENRQKALEYALAMGERSRRLYANQDAVAHFRQALQILDEQPNAEQAQKQRVLESLGDIYKLLGDHEQAYTSYSRAREAAASPSSRARLWRKLGDLAETRANYPEAAQYYRQAEGELSQIDDPAEQVNVWLAQARMNRSRGAVEEAYEICKRALLTSMGGKVDSSTSAALYFELGKVERERGHLSGASEYLKVAAHGWEAMGSLEKKALVAGALADVSYNRGELAEALRHYDEALEIQRRVLDRHGMASSLHGIGRTRYAMGDLDGALDCCTEALAIATEIDYRSLAANCMVQLGNIFLERGEIDKAADLIKTAYDGFKQIRNWRGSAHALMARARLLRAQGDPDHARTYLRRAWNLAEEMNDPWLRAQISVNEAELEEVEGRLERAQERATACIAMASQL